MVTFCNKFKAIKSGNAVDVETLKNQFCSCDLELKVGDLLLLAFIVAVEAGQYIWMRSVNLAGPVSSGFSSFFSSFTFSSCLSALQWVNVHVVQATNGGNCWQTTLAFLPSDEGRL
jgi:hypothetical protein